ncbi:MAG: TIGR03663 family protein [Phycisphaerae bacterium]|nr:TIGR03663 family protein [Phycisphaerae bacterium]
MTRNRTFVALIILLAAGAMTLRVAPLERRPLHGDEAVHAWKFDELWRTHTYTYDPYEYHGPTIYYFALPVVWLSGAHDFADMQAWMLRLVPATFGTGLILLLLLVADGLGRRAALWAALLTAVSPAFVYYSSYYIQETPLVFFTFATIVAGWRYVRSRRVGWALLTGVCIGLMHATKETCIIALGAMLASLLLCRITQCSGRRLVGRLRSRGTGRPPWRPFDSEPPPTTQKNTERSPDRAASSSRPTIHLALAALLAIAVSAIFMSGFGTNRAGPLDSIRTYTTYFNRAANGNHIHAWHYYLSMLAWTHAAPGPVWSELPTLALALIGLGAILIGNKTPGDRRLLRFIVIYTVLMVAIYSAIPYKTPWSMLGFLHGIILLAGVGASRLVAKGRRPVSRIIMTIVLLIYCAMLGHDAWRSCTTYAADNRNPYAYAHPVNDVAKVEGWLERLAAVAPAGHDMRINVISEDCWPLPWYLRAFAHTGYWETVPDQPDADVIIVAEYLYTALSEHLGGEYMSSSYGLRPGERVVVMVAQPLYDLFAAREMKTEDPPQ